LFVGGSFVATTVQAEQQAAACDLKFQEFFQLPIGPRGLEPTPKLLSLNGKRVRILGYMAHQEGATPGMFVLAPFPLEMGDEDESLADDLPANALFVHPDGSADTVVPYVSGIIQLTGVLQLGAREEVDGHVSQVRLQIDPAEANALLKNALSGRQAHR
jgi:hypothetical protein